MNNATLNAITINSSPLSPIQRVASSIVAAAGVVIEPRIYARALLGQTLQAAADLTATPRLLLRSVLDILAQATITTALRSFTTSPVSVTAATDILANGQVISRTEVQSPVAFSAQASITANGSVNARSPVSIDNTAQVVARESSRITQRSPATFVAAANLVATSRVYARVRDVLTWLAEARVTPTPGVGQIRRTLSLHYTPTVQLSVILNIQKNLPYDKAAVSERTVVVAAQDRVVYVE